MEVETLYEAAVKARCAWATSQLPASVRNPSVTHTLSAQQVENLL